MATTAHLGITLLEQSQAQKDVTVNEAFNRIDSLLNSGAIDKDLNTPPSTPAAGDVYIIAGSPTGAWSGHALAITYFDQVWRFIAPHAGALLWVNDEAQHYLFNGSAWALLTMGGGSGDMLKSTYDPANIGQQLAGLTATQTLSNKTLTAPVMTTPTLGAASATSINFGGSTLSVYEEGTFTPVARGTATAGSGTYSSQTGKYTRVGSVVHYSLYMGWSAHTGTGNLQVIGLPYNSAAFFQCAGGVYYNGFTAASGKQLTTGVGSSSTVINFYASDPAGGSVSVLAVDTAVSELAIVGAYLM